MRPGFGKPWTGVFGWLVVGVAFVIWAWFALEKGTTGPGESIFLKEVSSGRSWHRELGTAVSLWGRGTCLGVGSHETNLDCGRGHREFKCSPRRGFKAENRGLSYRGAETHLLLLGPLLASPRALTALLLDSHHEAPMLSRSLAASRPGATGRQGHYPPHPDGGAESWEQGFQGVRVPGSDQENLRSQ